MSCTTETIGDSFKLAVTAGSAVSLYSPYGPYYKENYINAEYRIRIIWTPDYSGEPAPSYVDCVLYQEGYQYANVTVQHTASGTSDISNVVGFAWAAATGTGTWGTIIDEDGDRTTRRGGNIEVSADLYQLPDGRWGAEWSPVSAYPNYQVSISKGSSNYLYGASSADLQWKIWVHRIGTQVIDGLP